MLNSRLIKNIIILVLVLGAAYFGYQALTGDTAGVPDQALSEDGGEVIAAVDYEYEASEASQESSREFVTLLRDVQNISFNSLIFQKELFTTNLADFSRPLPEGIPGRPDPFAPRGQNRLVPTISATVATTSNPAGR